MDYVKSLNTSWRMLSKLPPLSISEINDKIEDLKFKTIFKIIYNHVEISADTLSKEEFSDIMDFKTETGSNILMLVSYFGSIVNFDYLLSIGYDRNVMDEHGNNCLLSASSGGHIHMFEHLVSIGFDRNFTNKYDENSLLYACSYERIPMFDHLVSIGFNKNYVENALLIAAHHGNIQMFDHLISLGVDKNYVGTFGENALLVASHYGQIKMFDHLISLGFDMNFEDKYRQNALHYACSSSSSQIDMAIHLLRLGLNKFDIDDRFEIFKKAQSRFMKSRENLLIFQALVRLMMGFIKHRYWSPDGKGYHHAQQRFKKRINS